MQRELGGRGFVPSTRKDRARRALPELRAKLKLLTELYAPGDVMGLDQLGKPVEVAELAKAARFGLLGAFRTYSTDQLSSVWAEEYLRKVLPGSCSLRDFAKWADREDVLRLLRRAIRRAHEDANVLEDTGRKAELVLRGVA
jgi:hypothetical protein